MPAADRSPDLDRTSVAGAMRAGVLTCPSDAALGEVSDAMVAHRVHSVVVPAVREDPVHGEVVGWGLVTDLDVATAAATGRDAATAGELARLGAATVAPDDTLRHAARVMADGGATHVIVTRGALPVGVIAALDVAAVLARAGRASPTGA